jgi:hypothetical protein
VYSYMGICGNDTQICPPLTPRCPLSPSSAVAIVCQLPPPLSAVVCHQLPPLPIVVVVVRRRCRYCGRRLCLRRSSPSTTPPPRDLFDCCVYHHRICDCLLLLCLCLIATIIPLANAWRQVGGGDERPLPDHPSIHRRPSRRCPRRLRLCHRAITVVVDIVAIAAAAAIFVVVIPPISKIKGEGKSEGLPASPTGRCVCVCVSVSG